MADTAPAPLRTAAVAVPMPVRGLYHYTVPEPMDRAAVVGARVKVSFGKRTVVGYIVERNTPPPPGIGLRPIASVLDPSYPTFTADMVGFVRWMADYYHQSVGEALRGAHPAGTNLTGRPALMITPAGREAVDAGEGDDALLRLAAAEGPLPTSGFGAEPATVRRWISAGYAARTEIIAGPRVEARTVTAWRAIAPPPMEPRGRGGRPLKRDVIHAWLVGRGVVAQKEIEAEHGKARTHLNKLAEEGTVVMDAIEVVRDAFFGEQVARDRPRALNTGQQRAVDIITRAEGFHGFLLHGITGSGKTEVYLQAIERVLAQGRGALVLVPEIALTPQLVRRFRARLGDELAVLHSGLGDGARFDQWRRLRRGEVKLAIGDTLARGEQAIVFLNRRGFSTFAQCGRCGEVVECDNCAISMTWHKGRRQLRCHYCDAARPLPDRCGECGYDRFVLPGRGTEKVEEQLVALFPQARIARLDRDTATPRRMEEIFGAMRDRRLDILVGTQMVTKGHDFPYVTLVGVLDADGGLHFPDFRATERTFQLLAQVAGRAGRGDRPGRVLVQTRSPQHGCLQAAVAHDHTRFATDALAERKAFGYPPFGHAALIRFDGRHPGRVEELAGRAEKVLRRAMVDGVAVRGPAPAVLEKLRGRTRWALMLTAAHRRPLHHLVEALERANLPRAGDPRMIIDVDPHDLM